ncbi:uncharacterized protein ACHE_80812A [Aspergillus chevalieri]|uniref:Uncharacterized protein n=1 Tax=Aspergillus chevalieri TaxID=182096 RepID=A0A7R7ZTX0_ASPCH|nr:uncharacterized protein ACHE_80812A [Aspergillus chevalieri]BCR92912.1 hypothetical protein ACHE_80812A [Aspergillus chevalieri]
MGIDLSAITPGPGGTVMLGEGGGIEAAVRRGRERLRREALEREKAGAQNDTMSESTLVLASETNKAINPEPKKDESKESGSGGFKSRWREWSQRHMP